MQTSLKKASFIIIYPLKAKKVPVLRFLAKPKDRNRLIVKTAYERIILPSCKSRPTQLEATRSCAIPRLRLQPRVIGAETARCH